MFGEDYSRSQEISQAGLGAVIWGGGDGGGVGEG